MANPKININIIAPTPGAQIPPTLTITGGVRLDADGDRRVKQSGRLSVGVRLGDTDSSRAATMAQSGIWQFTGDVPADVPDGASIRISMVGSGSYTTDPDGAELFPADAGAAEVVVQLETRPLELTITPDFPTDVVPASLPYLAKIYDTTSGAQSGITEVRFQGQDGRGGLAENVSLSGDWSSWQAQFPLQAGDPGRQQRRVLRSCTTTRSLESKQAPLK